MLIEHNRKMKALDKGWVVESNFCLSQVGESEELRMKRSVLRLFPSATVHVTPAEAAEKLRALCASGWFKFVCVPLRKPVESVTHWVEMLESGRAPSFARCSRTHVPRPGDQSFLLLLACGCRPQADKPGRGVLHLSGRLDQLASTSKRSRRKSLTMFQICRSYRRSGGASGSSGPVGKLRKKNTDLDCARSSAMSSSIEGAFLCAVVHWNSRESHFLVES